MEYRIKQKQRIKYMDVNKISDSEQYKYNVKPYFMHVFCVGVGVHMLLFFCQFWCVCPHLQLKRKHCWILLSVLTEVWVYENTVSRDNIAVNTEKQYTCGEKKKKNISWRADSSAGLRCECFTVHACLLYVFRWACKSWASIYTVFNVN